MPDDPNGFEQVPREAVGVVGHEGSPGAGAYLPNRNAGIPLYGSAWAIRQCCPDLLRVGLRRLRVVVRMPRPEPEPQAIALTPGDHVQVQVRDGLAHNVVAQ